MRKGEHTRQRIIAQAAKVFNSRGYASASMHDIMDATKLKKGGIYRYFSSKDDLTLAAFDFSYNRLRNRYKQEVFKKSHAANRLTAILELHGSLLDDPYLEGGCPILRTAVECDERHPELLAKAQNAMDDWRHTIFVITAKGVARGELKQVDTEELSTVIIAALEGAVMLAKLYDDQSFIRRVIKHLKQQIDMLAQYNPAIKQSAVA